MYKDLLERVRSSRNNSVLLLSISLLELRAVLHPTPLCHIEYVTFFFGCSLWGNVKPAKNNKSINVSINSSPKGLASSYKSSASGFVTSSR